jgi:tungstate transport system ATP-binding protein
MGDIYQLKQVCHFYGSKKILDIEQMTISRGSILGISGANGSGKSTLLKLLAFAMAPAQGQIRFNGRPEAPMSPRVRSRVTLLTQTPYLLKRSVLDNVTYGLKVRNQTDHLQERAADALIAVGLDPQGFSGRMWHELSGGEAQRVAMAARLVLKPEALLLDEPVASVDTQSAALIRQASLAARDSWGCTLIIVSHDLSWLHEVSDTRISMADGKIFSTGKESIIPGPYARDNHGHMVRFLDDGSEIRLSDPFLPEHTANPTAVIQKEKLYLYPAMDTNGDRVNRLPARITQMLLEQKTGRILTTMDLKGFTLCLSVTANQAAQLDLVPGKQIILVFSPEDVDWR